MAGHVAQAAAEVAEQTAGRAFGKENMLKTGESKSLSWALFHVPPVDG